MAVIKHDITHVNWQLAMHQTDAEGGPIVTGYDDIHQSVNLIATTPIGSVPSNPAKGCDLEQAIDKPPQIAIPLICYALWEAISRWEPRIELGEISAREISFNHFAVAVPWKVKGSVASQIQTDIEIDLNRWRK